MKRRRSFSKDFKKEIVETVVSGQATAAEISREYHISPIMISKWKKDYKEGKFFDNVNSTDIARLELKVRELERLVGELTMENRMLKKVRDLNSKKKKEPLSIITSRTLKQLREGAD
jgi:transposase-like protein